jgi:hypothetical protein
MTAATQDILTPKLGAEDQVLPDLIQSGVAAATTIYGGTMVMINSSGYAVPAAPGTAGALGAVVGRAQRQAANTTANGYGTAGSLQVLIDRGAFWYNLNADSTVTIANFGASVYASDDNTVSLYDAGGTRPYAGYLICVPTTPGVPGLVNGSASTKVCVQVGQPNPWANEGEGSESGAFRARAVVTSLSGTYSGSTTGTLTAAAAAAFGTQDGVSTLAVGDTVLLPEGTTNITANTDAGLYTITTLGSTLVKWVLTRPDWWGTGSVINLAQTIDVGGEGTLFGGSSWKSFAAKGSAVVDSNDPDLYPGRVIQTVTLSAATIAISNVPILSATKTAFTVNLAATGGTVTGTLYYGTIVAPTAGFVNTGASSTRALVTVDAIAAGQVKNTQADASTLIVGIINW